MDRKSRGAVSWSKLELCYENKSSVMAVLACCASRKIIISLSLSHVVTPLAKSELVFVSSLESC
jgi:hypothetical protein